MLKNTLLFDGATGTEFANRTQRPSWQADKAVLDDPATILAIHQDYIHAGAQAIKTCTFGLPAMVQANPEEARAIVHQACALAQKAAEPAGALVFADLGPVLPAQDPDWIYEQLSEWFLEEGVDHFLLETLPSFDMVRSSLKKLKERAPEAFVLISFACASDGLSQAGLSAWTLLEQADQCELVDAIGLNCLCGPAHMQTLVHDLPIFDKPLCIMPNAGYPTVSARLLVYDGQPDYFARIMASIAHHSASMVGGCCGTTPAHIAALARRLEEDDQDRKVRLSFFQNEPSLPMRQPGILDERKKAGQKAILVELDPPATDRLSPFLEGASRLKQAGVDLLTIADNPIGRPRADSCLLACKVHREIGLDVLPHMTCRDRNLNAIKALLLGLSMEDIHQVLFVTGDPLPPESRQEVKAVFSFNSRTLARYANDLACHEAIAPLAMYGALDVNAPNFDAQLAIAHQKEQAGMIGFLTQPLFSKRAIANLKKARQVLHGTIYAGLMPIVSWRNANFLKNEITGMDIPDDLAEAFKDKSREECEELTLAFCLEIAGEIAGDVDGFYLMTPFQRISLIERLITSLKETGIVVETK